MDLPAERYRSLRSELAAHHEQSLAAVERLLDEIDPPVVRRLTEQLAFAPSDALPKRKRRPKPEPSFLAAHTYRGHAPGGGDHAAIIEFATCVTEWFDILDDVVDGDVKTGAEPEALIVTQVLSALATRRVHAFGDEAVVFWTDRSFQLYATQFARRESEPDAETYAAILRKEGTLFGFLTGIAALVAGADDEAVEHAAKMGRAFYAFEHLLIDAENHHVENDAWNAWRLMSTPTFRTQVEKFRGEVNAAASALPDEHARSIRDLTAVDVEAVIESARSDMSS